MTKFRKGDIVDVRGVVDSTISAGVYVSFNEGIHVYTCCINPCNITPVEPRKFAVDDAVRFKNETDLYRIVALHNNTHAWIERVKDGSLHTAPLKFIEHAD